jgi:hypothetical protein
MFPIPHPAFAKTYGLDAVPRPTAPTEIRLATAHDAGALVRLGQLGSALAAAAELPTRAAEGDVLVAQHGGELIAALALSDGLLVSDPLHRRNELIAQLHHRRAEIARGERPRRRSRLNALRPRHS